MYKSWNETGFIITEKGFIPTKFVVRYTADKIGKSLSIADEENGVMFQIPMDRISKEISEGKE